jgi:hypothetical protein
VLRRSFVLRREQASRGGHRTFPIKLATFIPFPCKPCLLLFTTAELILLGHKLETWFNF